MTTHKDQRRSVAGSRPVIRAGVVADAVPFDARRRLGLNAFDAFEQPGLANQLAKVDSERAALNFATRCGALGDVRGRIAERVNAALSLAESGEARTATDDPQFEIVGRVDLASVGDPLQWVYAQASSVALALELVAALGEGAADPKVEEILRRHSPYRLPEAIYRRAGGGSLFQRIAYQRIQDGRDVVFLVTLRVAKLADVREQLYMGSTPRDLARSIVVDLVNENSPEVHQTLTWNTTTGRFVFRRSAPSLIQVIWWHVASVAVAPELESRVRLCELCGTPFIVTDRRQRFCPPEGSGRSRCAALHQKRKERGLLPPEGAS